MPRRPERTDLHGLLRLAKPVGPSSNEVLQQVRRHLGWVKAGHAGTLDPAAAGLLLVLLGEAVKLVPYLADLAGRDLPLAVVEKAVIAAAMARHGGNKSQAARALGISRKLLYSKLREYGLGDVEAPDGEEA